MHGLTIFFFLTENACSEYQERIGSLQKAWGLVGHMLKNHGKHHVTIFRLVSDFR
jgi:hypothetical protein